MKEYKNELGQLHRVDGPAREYADGRKYWYQNDQFHRLDGPASEGSDGSRSWYVNGIEVTQEVETWLNEQKLSWPLNKSAQVLFILRFV